MINLLGNETIQSYKFRTKILIEINDNRKGTYNKKSP